MERMLPFTAEHEMFRKSFRSFLEKEIAPKYPEWEKNGIVDRDAYRKMGEQGYLCPWVDEKYGGTGADFLYSLIIGEEIARLNLTGFFVFLHSDIVAPYIDSFGTEEQKMRWLPDCVSGKKILAIAMTEPNAGSDLAAMRTRAVRDGNSYVLNGSKTFISNGILADLVMVAAKTDPQAGARGVSLFVVEAGTKGFERSKPIPKIGMHAQDTAELYFEDCRIPAENLLGQEGYGFYYLMQKLQQERLVAAMINQAVAEHCLEITLQYVKERQVFGKPLSSFQNTQFCLAELATEIQIGRTFVDALILQHMANKNVVQEVSMAKYWICEMVNRVATRCLQLFGGYGYCSEYEISKLFVDARVQTIYAGTSEIMKLIISRGLGLK
ncbi:MAG: acyl-CoA dehydrogenase [Syntrophomonadaceae bacterium]|nr:acyl-CoA dehydrogenase [Syntrophomonadaceae bacterium]